MKRVEQIQFLLEDLEKANRNIDIEINSGVEPEYFKKLLCMKERVSEEYNKNRALLKMQGFDFGLLFEKSDKEYNNFITWLNLMNEEVQA